MVRQLVAICQVCVETIIYAGGYTPNTIRSRGTTFDTVAYHCSGEENSLQACASVNRSSTCSEGALLECKQRNSSGKTTCGENRRKAISLFSICMLHQSRSIIDGY